MWHLYLNYLICILKLSPKQISSFSFLQIAPSSSLSHSSICPPHLFSWTELYKFSLTTFFHLPHPTIHHHVLWTLSFKVPLLCIFMRDLPPGPKTSCLDYYNFFLIYSSPNHPFKWKSDPLSYLKPFKDYP